ncbi:MAG: hypothetical protein QOH25_2623 [Acidobacteriota bacterium]|jgi:hypothetical protein|nr:hypothetical protein [Acidobacteriota bacterium]
MIPLKRIPLLLAIFLTFTITGFAQKFCTVAPPSPFKHSALIVTSYDQRAHRMKTTLEHPNALGNGLHLYASFYYQDPRLRSLPVIDIFFISAAKKPLYRESHDLNITADGHLWPFSGVAQYYTEDGPKGLILEKTRITLTYASLLSLLKAHRVRARLGAAEFELTNNHLESLREIAMLMAPPPPRNLARR